jgi:hypothetical protein
MRALIVTLVMLLVAALVVAERIDLSKTVISVDLLVPLDPNARSGDAQGDFAAAKRIVRSDIGALEAALAANDTDFARARVATLQRSLGLLGDVGGFTSPLVEDARGPRSLALYREIVGQADAISAALGPGEEAVPDANEAEGNATPAAEPEAPGDEHATETVAEAVPPLSDENVQHPRQKRWFELSIAELLRRWM